MPEPPPLANDEPPPTLRRLFLFVIGFVFLTVILGPIAFSFRARRQMSLMDAAALDCVRGVRDWEIAFSEVNGGLFAPRACILQPHDCGAKAPAPSVPTPACLAASPLDNAEALTHVSLPGYKGRLRTSDGRSALSSTYLMTLEPVAPGMTGMQLIGVDERGRICVVRWSDKPTLFDSSGRLRTDCDSTQ